jgi:hypothetical protein
MSGFANIAPEAGARLFFLVNPLVLSLVWFGRALTAPFRAVRARRLMGKSCVVVLKLDGPLVEMSDRRPFWRRISSRAP